jgi:hypothetical protein
MFSAGKWVRALTVSVVFLSGGSALAVVVDDDVPDVTGRVARISYIGGDVQVRRSGAQDWEKAVLNLPVVEGDEIVTSENARLEIQIDTRTFVRIEERSDVRIATLKDEGIALSVPTGTISIRVNEFDRDRAFIEVDIPNTTIAVQRPGLYRIDAGPADSAEARVRVTDGGEVRIYSDTSGFTLKNGRMATIYLTGSNAGEWDTTDASRYSDEFDTWTLDRDTAIAKRLRDAFYDRYYDRDIYGAEDLSDYGDWVYTRKYGYVWRPFRTSVSRYADWSPYRYGHWRWIPPFGWTWVNDEPWGWATYHYGRWVWDAGYWYWTPYGYYRYRRSWWQPALVVITIYNNNICWYPLPYHYRYYNYNWNYNQGGYWPRRQPDPTQTGGGGTGPTTSPTPNNRPGPVVGLSNDQRRQRALTPPLSSVPPGGVVTVPADQWGKKIGVIQKAPLEVAKTVLSKDPEGTQTPPILPPYEQVKTKIDKEIRVETPPIIQRETAVKTGAVERKSDQPLDDVLRKSRMLGDREPLVIQNPAPAGTKPSAPDPGGPRRTGAVVRPEVKPRDETPAAETPPYVPPSRTNDRKYEPPTQKQEQPRYEPRRETPRYDPPKTESPRYDPPKSQPPVYSPPTKREDPPPSKSEPKPDKPSSPPLGGDSKKKDGR